MQMGSQVNANTHRAPLPRGNRPTLPGAAAVWKSAHLAGRRCRVEIRPPCRALLPRGNRPTLPGAAAVWESAHLARRRCHVGIGPPCRALLPHGNAPTFLTEIKKTCQMTGSKVWFMSDGILLIEY